MTIIITLFLALSCAAAVPSETDPATLAFKFYSSYQDIGPCGIPQPADLQKLEPLFTTRLRSLLHEARRYQSAYAKRHPEDKPPFVDGDLFTSNFEGFKTFSVGVVKQQAGGAYRVEVTLSYWEVNDPKAIVKWTDAIIVVREQGRLLIDDFEFLGTWPFAQKGRLSDLLRERP
jgi:hypothetical protein